LLSERDRDRERDREGGERDVVRSISCVYEPVGRDPKLALRWSR